MRRSLLTAVLLTSACYRLPEFQDDAIVHTDRLGYHHAYWHDPTVTAAHHAGDVPLASIVPAGAALVDLTHVFDRDTIYWPAEKDGFRRVSKQSGEGSIGGHYETGSFSAPEHGGTHLDAPSHFVSGRQSADAVPLPSLMARVLVIDITAKATANADAQLEPSDIDGFEKEHGLIARGSIVLVRTGWSARWPDRKRYLGDDRPGATDKLHFPGISAAAAKRLVERDVAAVGIDTASLDHGPSKTFEAHRTLANADVPMFENVARLETLPEVGAVLIALPMKIRGGSGAPVRIVAVVPR